MKVVNKESLDKFTTKHSDSVKAIDRWIEIIEQTTFLNHNELKLLFPSVDYVGNSRYVFNIKGNDYRLVAIVLFARDLAMVCFIETHAEYEK